MIFLESFQYILKNRSRKDLEQLKTYIEGIYLFTRVDVSINISFIAYLFWNLTLENDIDKTLKKIEHYFKILAVL